MTSQEPVLIGYKLRLARSAWWVVFFVWGTFAAYYFLYLWMNGRAENYPNVSLQTLDITTSLAAFLFAVFLFAKKSNNWMAILVSMMLITQMNPDSGFSFWLVRDQGWLAVDTSGQVDLEGMIAILKIYDFVTPFQFAADLIFLTTFLTFPNGRWIFQHVWWIPVGLSVVFALESSQLRNDLLDARSLAYLKFFFFFAITGGLQFLHYRRIPNSIQRQQIKWIVIFLLAILLTMLINLISMRWFLVQQANWLLLDGSTHVQSLMDKIMQTIPFMDPIINLCLVMAFGISIFRYRLWDTDTLINNTLLYGTLTGLLSLLGIVSVAGVNFLIKQAFGEDESSIWALIVSALPVAASFNPLRDRLKIIIDRYYKPEEVNFTDTFIEFTPAVLELLSTRRIIEIITMQAIKQLNVDFAKVYLLQKDGRFQTEQTDATTKKTASLNINDKQLQKLKAGKPVVDDDEGTPYSLLVPLIVQRARFPDFLGVLALGRRLDGTGYPTQILNSLEVLGSDAGKAIYLSQINKQSKQKRKLHDV